jgi:hypothetical protein
LPWEPLQGGPASYGRTARHRGDRSRPLEEGLADIYLHGLGYYLWYLLNPDIWKRPAYAARTIVNAILYRLSGRRLPGFLGDSIFQSERRLRRYDRSTGLVLESATRSRCFLGQLMFIGHVVRK